LFVFEKNVEGARLAEKQEFTLIGRGVGYNKILLSRVSFLKK
jgi:hypothetical protein